MSFNSNSSRWKKLESCAFRYFSPPIFINKHEFVICPSNHHNCISDGVYSYNIKQNKWKKIFSFPDDFECYIHSAAYHDKTRTLYLALSDDLRLFKVDLNAMELKEDENIECEDHSRLIISKNELHLTGDYRNGKSHQIFVIQDDQIRAAHSLQIDIAGTDIIGHALIHLKSQNCLFLFGGEGRTTIHKFSMLDRKWIKMKAKLPKQLQYAGIVSTRDERHILLFGGCLSLSDDGPTFDNIYIYDVRNNALRESRIKCPFTGSCGAVISDDLDEEKLIVAGFINKCYTAKDFVNLQVLPYYLIELISEWYQNQQVYLIREDDCGAPKEEFEAVHFSINVDDILQ